MNNNEAAQIQIDPSRLYDFIQKMDKKAITKAERTALRKSVGLIKSQTVRNIRARWRGGVSTRHGRKISEGVVASVNKSTGGDLYGQVHIMGTGNTGSRGYILKFFEMGTVDRFAKVRSRAYRGRGVDELKSSKAGYRGKIKPLWFFRDAVKAKKEAVFDEMEDRMQSAVVDQWAKSAAKAGKL